MEINFCGSPKKPIEINVQRLFENSDRISIAVAYVKKSGVDFISKYISDEKGNCTPDISVITGFDFFLTDADALQELMEMGVRCRVVRNTNFHPKLYIFEKDENVTLIVGSSNLSKGGLVSNCEANLIIKGKICDKPIKDALEYFSSMQLVSSPLNEHAIELYRKINQKSNQAMPEIIVDEEIRNYNNELQEYLNQIDNDNEFSICDKQLLDSLNEKLQDAASRYIEGNIYDCIELLKEVYNDLNNIDEPNSISALHLKFECNRMLFISFDLIGDIKEEQCYIHKTESLGKTIYYKEGDSRPYLLGLSYITGNETADRMMEKCDEFINVYKKHHKEIDDNKDADLYSRIGVVYLLASELKINSDINLFNKYIAKSETYHKKYLQFSEDSYSIMFAHYYLADFLTRKDSYKSTTGKNEKAINDHYHEALRIAQKEFHSKFWEGFFKIKIAEYDAISHETKRQYLKHAERIFKELEYPELVKQVRAIKEEHEMS